MSRKDTTNCLRSMVILFSLLIILFTPIANSYELKRGVPVKPNYKSLPTLQNTDQIVIKFKEGITQPKVGSQGFMKSTSEWNNINQLLSYNNKTMSVTSHFDTPKAKLDEMRQVGTERSGIVLPDLSLYNDIKLDASMTDAEKVDRINSLNESELIEIAYFPPIPEDAIITTISTTPSSEALTSTSATPFWVADQYYLNPAPEGVDARYAWAHPGGNGANVLVIDIERNWNQTHEDLHGGIDTFVIAGNNDPNDSNHGTAVMGIMAADSNNFGMTGISHAIDIGAISSNSYSTSAALNYAVNHSEVGDFILIEQHAPGPDASGEGQDGYVCMEYWSSIFDAILTASANGRIVVEAAGNGAEDFDDVSIYGQLFDPEYRFSGAIIVGASSIVHVPAYFTNYGQRVDAHGFGLGDVYSLAYGDLYGAGSSQNVQYTATFSGTSSASPVVNGACAAMQGVQKALYGTTLDHNEIRTIINDYGTPQAPHTKHIGPLPDLKGAVDYIYGVTIEADTTFGWVPFDVQFSGASHLAVDTWTWDFGDGDSAFTQSPLHTFTDNGLYTVGIEIDASGDVRQRQQTNYIVALADTIKADSVKAIAGETVEFTIYLNNSVPLERIEIPIEYDGDMLTYDSYSTEGCRTDYFDMQGYSNLDLWNKRLTIYLLTSPNGTLPSLPTGEGAVLKLQFTVNPTAVIGETNPIFIDGYKDYVPRVESKYGNYNLVLKNGLVYVGNCCKGIRGNIDADLLEIVDISDLVYLVDFMFTNGPAPECVLEGNVDGDIEEIVDISDLVMLVDFMFTSGSPPVTCP